MAALGLVPPAVLEGMYVCVCVLEGMHMCVHTVCVCVYKLCGCVCVQVPCVYVLSACDATEIRRRQELCRIEYGNWWDRLHSTVCILDFFMTYYGASFANHIFIVHICHLYECAFFDSCVLREDYLAVNNGHFCVGFLSGAKKRNGVW